LALTFPGNKSLQHIGQIVPGKDAFVKHEPPMWFEADQSTAGSPPASSKLDRIEAAADRGCFISGLAGRAQGDAC
jgi:hypothetical protein